MSTTDEAKIREGEAWIARNADAGFDTAQHRIAFSAGWDAALRSPAPSGEATALNEVGPWPLRDVLAKLADAADHYGTAHDCDHHGYEEVLAARDAARAFLALPEMRPSSEAAPSGTQEREALRVLADFAKTAPGRLPQRVQDAIALAHPVATLAPREPQPERPAYRYPVMTAEEAAAEAQRREARKEP